MFLISVNAFFLFLYACLFFFYYRSWRSLQLYEPLGGARKSFISVVIAARNEESNISSILRALQNQTYDFFEVIIVDDFSTDRTAEFVGNAMGNIRIIQPDVPKEKSSKKKAIEAGISNARGELIVTTDADCQPSSQWLEVLNEFYNSTGASFIAAPVKFHRGKSLLHTFQSLDFITLQGITAASVASGFHTMCNGANMAYQRQAFIDVRGFDGIDKVATGDDMLLMYKIWKKNPAKVFYLKNSSAIVNTEPMPTWKDFLMQRKRWASKTLVYDDITIIFVLFFVYLLNCFFVFQFIAAFIKPELWWFVISFLIIKSVIEAPFVYEVAKFYREQKIIKYLLLLQPLHIFYTVAIGFISQFGRYEWKGRRTK